MTHIFQNDCKTMILFKLVRVARLVGLLFLLVSCNTLYLGYNNLNWLTRWRLDSYLDLTSEQDRWLNVQLAEHITWHRKEELPQYVDFLRDIQLKARDGLTQEEWRAGLEQVELGRGRQCRWYGLSSRAPNSESKISKKSKFSNHSQIS